MSSDKLIQILETYSNAIVAFMVVQSIAFAITFGTNTQFNCIVKSDRFLALGLIFHFAFSSVLAWGAIAIMSKTMQRISAEHLQIFRGIYWARIMVVFLFAGLPVAVLCSYGLNTMGYAQCFAMLKPS